MMTKQTYGQLTWKCKFFDCNRQIITDYDILKYREDFIKKLKKKCATKEEFAEKMRREMIYYYWSKAEVETIIEIDEDNHIWLGPWVGCREPEKAKIDVTDDENFDWKGFAKLHIGKQIYKNKAKIDVYSQLEYVWDDFITYLWTTHLRYERDNPKFHE